MLLKKTAKFAAVFSIALAFMCCSDDSDGGTNPVSGNDVVESSSAKVLSSSATVVRDTLIVKQGVDSQTSSSAKAASSSSAKVPASSAATPKSSAALSSAAAPKSSASKPVSSSATVAQSSSAKIASSSSLNVASSSSAKVPASSATSNSFFGENWRQACLDKINEYRATENLAPLTLAPEAKQTCTDNQAAADMEANKAHGHFGDCGEWAQNSGPNFNTSWRKTAIEVSDAYLKMMWEDEKALVTSGERDPQKDEDYPYIGHYLNMKGNYKTVACGIALSADGKKGWFNVNFF